MTTYTIRVINQSGVNKSFAVFMQPPAVTSPGGQTPVYTNAWAVFENVPDGGWDSVDYTPEGAQAAEGSPAPYFAVAEGVFTPGQVSAPSEGANVATIDFAGRPETTAAVTEHPDDNFSVAYV